VQGFDREPEAELDAVVTAQLPSDGADGRQLFFLVFFFR
jgi:hypothetical protein